MAAKPNIKRQITQSALALRAVMIEHLSRIAQNMVDQIISRLERLPESQRMNAINDLAPVGIADYKSSMLAAMSVIAADALKQVRSEVPKAKNVKLAEGLEDRLLLGEFESLPAAVRNKLFKQYQILTETQIGDLEKKLLFSFGHSVDSTDSMALIRSDLEDTAFEFTSGNRITAGSTSIAAQTVNDTRNEFFDDPEVQDQIDAFEFMNDDPVSEICNDLAGSIFEVDDPDRFRYTPPLHFNCKSWIRPILKGNNKKEITGLRPSSQEVEDTIQFSEKICGCGDFHVEAR